MDSGESRRLHNEKCIGYSNQNPRKMTEKVEKLLPKKRNAIVSACLLGINCKYDGNNSKSREVLNFLEKNNLNPIPVCPEQLGGLPTPRKKHEIVGGEGKDVLKGVCSVYNEEGDDVTENFVRGAEETLKLALITNAKIACLKSNSPSCGVGYIYDGSFSGVIRGGDGVTASLLLKKGIEVFIF